MAAVIRFLGMVFYPLVVHLLIKLDATWLAVAGLVVTSVVYLFLVAGFRRDTGAHPGWMMLYLFLSVLGSINLFTDTHYVLFFPAFFINLAIAAAFGLSLRSNTTALVTQMMCFEYGGEMPPAPVAAYGRRLTLVWAVYFASVALVSVWLAATTTLENWSWFVNVLHYVFALSLLAVQYLYRVSRYRQYGVFMPWDTLRGMARHPWPGRVAPAGAKSK